ncbi:MAG TPA: response regulator [Syntrophales bacterium]|nr:response regulator [Syntrophales bacterium]
MKLLVVDDNPNVRNFLSTAMKLNGHTVDTANDGIDAINLRLNNRYDAVITDADMPRMDGFRLCKFMKEQFPETRIIGMSGAWGEKAFKKAGADVCLSQPFSVADLKRAVESRPAVSTVLETH